MTTHHLAQLNITKTKAPMTDPLLVDFVNGLDRINQLADGTPGFVWRLKSVDVPAGEEERLFGERIIVNMSVWESLEQLFQFSYYSDHVEFFRRRGEWMERPDVAMVVLWWVPAGHIPTMEEAKERLLHLRQYGATEYAFTFKTKFPAPVEQVMSESRTPSTV